MSVASKQLPRTHVDPDASMRTSPPTAPAGVIRFQPLNLANWIVWGLTALLFLALPLIFRSGFALTLLSQMGIAIIFCLSYNMLFGQGGMLSFGHAVYS